MKMLKHEHWAVIIMAVYLRVVLSRKQNNISLFSTLGQHTACAKTTYCTDANVWSLTLVLIMGGKNDK